MSNKLKTVIKLSAEWCSPCKVYKQTFDKAKDMEEYKDIEFKEVDIENDSGSESIVENYKVQTVPTTLLLDENGELINKIIGNVSFKDLRDNINQALNNGEQ